MPDCFEPECPETSIGDILNLGSMPYIGFSINHYPEVSYASVQGL